MKVFLLSVFLVGCCPQLIKPDQMPQDESQTIDYTEINKKQNLITQAAREIVNEKLIKFIENGPSDWLITSFDIIVRTKNLTNEYFDIGLSFSTIYLFQDGSIFLDTAEQPLSLTHKERLKVFYLKVKNAVSKIL